MGADVVIRADGLGKKYMIGHRSTERYTALRDVLTRSVSTFARTTRDMLSGKALVAGDKIEEFWALKDVRLEIRRGDVVGIIGRNGAGKSTLLKVLSRITEPSAGRIEIKGRVASLLEVGTGFHAELTGRENIYLNGAILGMTRAEIRRKFDEIIDFAGVEKFLDTPVKRYSSGMYVRLAFAVAAHLEPEILIVDEVLAVGDAEFQSKCLGKMRDVAGDGRSILFVSHNMSAVRQLCSRGILLEKGGVAFDGLAAEAITDYIHAGRTQAAYHRTAPPDAAKPCLTRAAIAELGSSGNPPQLHLHLDLGVHSPRARKVNLDFRIRDEFGTAIAFASLGALDGVSQASLQQGETALHVIIDVSALAVGTYRLSIDVTDPWVEFYERAEDVVEFAIGPEHWRRSTNPLKAEYGMGTIWLSSELVKSEALCSPA
jgi:lipopolysaccharide transport system ATP-binding protein